jgi:hypothetical protein
LQISQGLYLGHADLLTFSATVLMVVYPQVPIQQQESLMMPLQITRGTKDLNISINSMLRASNPACREM